MGLEWLMWLVKALLLPLKLSAEVGAELSQSNSRMEDRHQGQRL